MSSPVSGAKSAAGQSKRFLLLVSGPPGAGKSTLAGNLAREFSLVWLDKDAVDEPFSPNDRGPAYKKEIEPKVLEALLNLARLNFEAGRSVLIDLPWTHVLLNRPGWKEKVEGFAADCGARLIVFELYLSEALLRERIKERGLDRDTVKLTPEGWERFKTTNRIFERVPLPHILLDAAEAPEACFQKACIKLREVLS